MTNKIREYRARYKVTQQQLADKIGVTRQTIHTVETGHFIPSITLAIKISRYFKVSVADIFILEDEDFMVPNNNPHRDPLN